MNEDARSQELLGVCRWLEDSGFTPGTSGNLSVRAPGAHAFLITPAGVPYGEITAASLVRVDANGPAEDGEPSSEWRMHAAIYRARPDVDAVVHAHPRAATALSCLRRSIPPFHYSVALGGGDEIPCTGYATFGTQALAELVADALAFPLRACLMANHGLVCAGASPADALALAREVEALADHYLLALSAGSPVLLDAQEMARVRKQFAVYGRDRTAADAGPDAALDVPGGLGSGREAPRGPAPAHHGASIWDERPTGSGERPPLVLLAHGSRDPGWKAAFENAAARLAAAGERDVRLAFLQFDRPDLPAVAARLREAGVRSIRLLPLFFAAGRHLGEDVPALVRQLEDAGTEVEVLDAPAQRAEFGEALADLLARIAAT